MDWIARVPAATYGLRNQAAHAGAHTAPEPGAHVSRESARSLLKFAEASYYVDRLRREDGSLWFLSVYGAQQKKKLRNY